MLAGCSRRAFLSPVNCHVEALAVYRRINIVCNANKRNEEVNVRNLGAAGVCVKDRLFLRDVAPSRVCSGINPSKCKFKPIKVAIRRHCAVSAAVAVQLQYCPAVLVHLAPQSASHST